MDNISKIITHLLILQTIFFFFFVPQLDALITWYCAIPLLLYKIQICSLLMGSEVVPLGFVICQGNLHVWITIKSLILWLYK